MRVGWKKRKNRQREEGNLLPARRHGNMEIICREKKSAWNSANGSRGQESENRFHTGAVAKQNRDGKKDRQWKKAKANSRSQSD